VTEEVWVGFLTMRSLKHAPVTALAMRLMRAEAAKAGWALEAVLSECVLRGWRGFRSDWVEKQTKTFTEIDYTTGLSPDGVF
jgi:hypothetical protein